MDLLRALPRLWRHPLFRRLLALRVATQASDAALQVGLAAYVLFSPSEQPDAGSIAAVLAITLLPFSLIGPFLSPSLDRWDRRRVFAVTDLLRAMLAGGLGLLVLLGGRSPAAMGAIFVLALAALSINRFLMAAMSATLSHTVDADEYLVASSVMPIVGPVGAILGAGAAGAIRLIAGASVPVSQADAMIFVTGALGFVLCTWLALRFPRRSLGPDAAGLDSAGLDSAGSGRQVTRVPLIIHLRQVVADLAAAVRHLRARPAAGLGLVTIFAQRIVYGMITVNVILLYRSWFHPVAEVGAALAGLGSWLAATGAGFVAASVILPLLSRRTGLRRAMIIVLAGCAVAQILPGSIITEPTLIIAGFTLGVMSQALKIAVDTLVQAHVDDTYKGRVFTLYDMIFNLALVGAAILTMISFPPNGYSIIGFVILGGAFAVIAAGFAVSSARLGAQTFERGTPGTRVDQT